MLEQLARAYRSATNLPCSSPLRCLPELRQLSPPLSPSSPVHHSPCLTSPILSVSSQQVIRLIHSSQYQEHCARLHRSHQVSTNLERAAPPLPPLHPRRLPNRRPLDRVLPLANQFAGPVSNFTTVNVQGILHKPKAIDRIHKADNSQSPAIPVSILDPA